MRYLVAFLGVFLLSVSSVGAQGYEYRVLSNRGPATLNGQHMQHGAEIGLADKLEMQHGSYVALVHNDGRILELQHEGSYTGASLRSLDAREPKGMGDRYAEFVSERMWAMEEEPANRIVGAVSRAAADHQAHPVYLPIVEGTMVFLLPELGLAWAQSDQPNYEIAAHDIFVHKLWNAHTSDTVMFLNEDRLDELKDQVMHFTITPDGGVESEIYPVVWKRTFKDEIEKSHSKAYISAYKKAETAADYAVLAMMMENEGLLVDASTCWLRAVEMDSDAYLPLYRSFVARHDMG